MLRSALVLFALAACSAPRTDPDAGRVAARLAPPPPVTLILPEAAADWHAPLAADARELDALLERELARWPRRADAEGVHQAGAGAPGALRPIEASHRPQPTRPALVLAAEPGQAAAYAAAHALPGDPRVPRTHLHRRVALLSLPRVDRLLLDRPTPPRTLRETIRHELVHLLTLDRPAFVAAPVWFQEGVAETYVGLAAVDRVGPASHALGACWWSELAAALAGREEEALHAALADQPAELRYSAWAALALRLMRLDPGPRPWQHPDAAPTVGAFLAATRPAEPEHVWPRVFGREVDFQPDGRSLLLASAAGESVAVEVGPWTGQDALELRVRVGQSGQPLAELRLGHPGAAECLRVRVNHNAAIVAGWESRVAPPARSLRDRRPPGTGAPWRSLSIHWQPQEQGIPEFGPDAPGGWLAVVSGDYRERIAIRAADAPSAGRPWLVQARVRDGAAEWLAADPWLPALR